MKLLYRIIILHNDEGRLPKVVLSNHPPCLPYVTPYMSLELTQYFVQFSASLTSQKA